MSACLKVVSDPCLDEREAKFLPDAEAAHAFWAIASQHLRPAVETAPFSYARTTYFDTPDFAYHRSSGRRLRVREYAAATYAHEEPVVAERCYLEVKQSSGGRRTKTRLPLRVDQVTAELPRLVDVPVEACVATWYRRRALVDASGDIRLTLDENLLLCRPRPIGSSFAFVADDVLAEGPAFVLEYKSWIAAPPWLAFALAGLDEAVGFSKFELGMDALVRRSELRAAAAR